MPTKASIMKRIAEKMNVPFSNKPTTHTVDNSDTGIPMIMPKITVISYSDGTFIRGTITGVYENRLLVFVINNEAFIRPDLSKYVQDTLRSWLTGRRVHQPVNGTERIFDHLGEGRITRREAVFEIVLVKVRTITDTSETEQAADQLYDLWKNA